MEVLNQPKSGRQLAYSLHFSLCVISRPWKAYFRIICIFLYILYKSANVCVYVWVCSCECLHTYFIITLKMSVNVRNVFLHKSDSSVTVPVFCIFSSLSVNVYINLYVATTMNVWLLQRMPDVNVQCVVFCMLATYVWLSRIELSGE